MPLSREQLISVKRLLKEAEELVGDARAAFCRGGDTLAAERLREIGRSIRDEIEYTERLLPLRRS
jgi:hypothetical protein